MGQMTSRPVLPGREPTAVVVRGGQDQRRTAPANTQEPAAGAAMSDWLPMFNAAWAGAVLARTVAAGSVRWRTCSGDQPGIPGDLPAGVCHPRGPRTGRRAPR